MLFDYGSRINTFMKKLVILFFPFIELDCINYILGMTSSGVTFEIGEEAGGSSILDEEKEKGWECVWKCRTANPTLHMAFSPDGTLFATAGFNDRLVKIWFENKQCKLNIVKCFATFI